MNLFNFNKKTENEGMQDLDNRLKTFLDKLTQRADELYKEVKASAQSIADEDQDSFKRSYHQFKSGIIAQFNGIMQKGSNTFHTQVLPSASGMQNIRLSEYYNTWHNNILNMMVHVFDDVQERDLEKEYAEAMAEYNRQKDLLHCTQCGGKLTIDKFYYVATYIKCPYCQTQNTFDPGSKAKMVELFVWPLAELRCSQLKKRHRNLRQNQGLEGAFESYQEYAKALIKEMDSILPGLEAQHQDFYNRLIHDYKAFGAPW